MSPEPRKAAFGKLEDLCAKSGKPLWDIFKARHNHNYPQGLESLLYHDYFTKNERDLCKNTNKDGKLEAKPVLGHNIGDGSLVSAGAAWLARNNVRGVAGDDAVDGSGFTIHSHQIVDDDEPEGGEPGVF